MSLDIEILIRDFAEELVSKLKASTKRDTIFWRFDGKRLQVGSTDSWITVLEDGRPPGKWPPRQAIRNWIDSVGIQSDVPKDSLAFLIQRSIGQKGTLLWQRGGKSGVLSNYLNQEYIHKNLVDPLRKEMMNTVVETLLR